MNAFFSFKIFFTSILLLYSVSIYSQSGWFILNTGTSANLYSIHFPVSATGLTGYAAGNNGTIIKTSNGGLNWIQLTSGTSNPLNGIFFSDINTGYVAGDEGTIIKTTNGGINWTNLNSGITDPIYSVVFIDVNTGFTAGIGFDKILKTTNSGSNWTIQTAGGVFGQFGVSFADANTGCTVGLNASINRTTNGGTNWTLVRAASSDDLLLSVFLKNEDLAFAAGDNGLILKSTNAGINWNDISFGNDLLHSVLFITDDIGYIAGTGINGVILKTTDSGTNWIQQISGTSSSLVSLSFTDLSTGYVCGSQGTVLKTTTGGVMTGFTSNHYFIPGEFSLGQNFPNPFNPKTIINYQCSVPAFITLKVYNFLGDEVVPLVNEMKAAGSYEVEFDGNQLASGIYFYTLEANNSKIESKQMILLK